MVFYNLSIGSFDIKYTPLKPKEVESFPYCDNEGKILKRIVEGKGKVFFLNELTGQKTSVAYRLINGKARDKFPKTKEVINYKEVDSKEVEDLFIKGECLAIGELLKRDLEDTGKAIKFAFSNGQFSRYIGYVYVSELYNSLMFVYGTKGKAQAIKEIYEEQKEQKKAQELDLIVGGIERAKVEDLIQI